MGGGALEDIRRLDGVTNGMAMSLNRLQEMMKDRRPGVLECMGSQRRIGSDFVAE